MGCEDRPCGESAELLRTLREVVECIGIEDHRTIAALDELYERTAGSLASTKTGSYGDRVIETKVLTCTCEALRRLILSDQRLRDGEVHHRIGTDGEMYSEMPCTGSHRSPCRKDGGTHLPLRSGDEERPTVVVLIGKSLA